MTDMTSKDSQNTHSRLHHAKLEWRDNGLPVSTEYDDVYFCTDAGLHETNYTFLKQNRLAERFKTLKAGDCFTVGETGFGTGLSFMCVWRLFDKYADSEARLHFVSAEKHPMRPEDWHRALDLWPEFARYTSQLKHTYQPACHGQQHFVFDHGRVRLTLLIGDAQKTLPEFCGTIDAWFLDGFNPAKNPDMWQPALFHAIAAKSHPQTTYATFSAARLVRDGLKNAGFSVEKLPGYGKKRHMVKGRLIADQLQASSFQSWQTPSTFQPKQKRAIVIGGGLAGTSTARSLAQRGWQVRLLERHNNLASEASGNPQAILYAKLSAHPTPLTQLVLQGYLYTINLLKCLEADYSDLWQQTGVVQIPASEKDKKRHLSLTQQHDSDLLTYRAADQLTKTCGITVSHDGLFFPHAGWVDPRRFCQALADHPNITTSTNISVQALARNDSKWILLDETQQEIDRCETVIMAGGTHSNQLPQLQPFPIKTGAWTNYGSQSHSSQFAVVYLCLR